jgi:peptide chain release factor 3
VTTPLDEITRRRTFAIISHPDAGKTTLTEKLLLYGGAVRLAGTVTARKSERATASDWMELEKQRGISISSTVLQFDYAGFRINLLDTPGHRDFSEDTYRVLTAVDAAVMVIDAGKGIEAQTRKLFEVCRRRGVPIFTFINKLDRPAREPLDLLDELEKVLGLESFPVNWPLGAGPGFRGVYDRLSRQVHLFERTPGGAYKAPLDVLDPSDPVIRERLHAEDYKRFMEEIELLDVVGTQYDAREVLSGTTTPVFFGSAVNNFGVQLLLDGFLGHSPSPVPRESRSGPVAPDLAAFSAFIFKIQANMDPRHRDRIAFARVCSGRFSRDMTVHHSGTGRRVRLANSHKIFGQDREIVDEAWPGDIVGLVGHSDFQIGDTLAEDPGIVFDEIPRFPPECFAVLHNSNPAQFKPFRKGLEQLIMEGLVQPFFVASMPHTATLLAAVGPLQFEVLQYRLKSEYGVESRLESPPWQFVRWAGGGAAVQDLERSSSIPSDVRFGRDAGGALVVFFPNDWSCRYFMEKHPGISLHELPPRESESVGEPEPLSLAAAGGRVPVSG